MADNITSIFDRHGTSTETTSETASEADTRPSYRAAIPFLADEERAFILARMSNGDLRLVSYSYLVEIISVSPGHLAFIYTNGVLHLRGTQVRDLLPSFQQRQVKELVPFQPDEFAEPEAEAPLIRDLIWRTVEEALADAGM